MPQFPVASFLGSLPKVTAITDNSNIQMRRIGNNWLRSAIHTLRSIIPTSAEMLINPSVQSIFIGLAKLTTSPTLLLADSLGPSLSPHVPAVVAVPSVLADVYSTVMKWLTSDQPQAERQTVRPHTKRGR